jgi:hypothetical protein
MLQELEDKMRPSSRKTKSSATASAGRCAWDNLSLAHYKFRVLSSMVGGRRTAVFACFASLLHCSRISSIPSHPTLLPVNKDRLPQSTRTLLAQALVVTSGRIFPLPPEAGPAFTMLVAEPKKLPCSSGGARVLLAPADFTIRLDREA